MCVFTNTTYETWHGGTIERLQISDCDLLTYTNTACNLAILDLVIVVHVFVHSLQCLWGAFLVSVALLLNPGLGDSWVRMDEQRGR